MNDTNKTTNPHLFQVKDFVAERRDLNISVYLLQVKKQICKYDLDFSICKKYFKTPGKIQMPNLLRSDFLIYPIYILINQFTI